MSWCIILASFRISSMFSMGFAYLVKASTVFANTN